MIDDIKINEDKYKQEIFNLNNIIDNLNKEKEKDSNIDIIRQNKELKEKNNNLPGFNLGLKIILIIQKMIKNIIKLFIILIMMNIFYIMFVLINYHFVHKLNFSSKINENGKKVIEKQIKTNKFLKKKRE